MMGAGDYEAGEGLAGHDPVATPAALRDVTAPQALLFDGATRDFPIDALGRYQDLHPVDQGVVLALLIGFGLIGSAPATGSTLRQIKYAGGPRLEADIRDRVHRALARPLAANDIQEIRIVVSLPKAGAVHVVYDYVNLRAPGVPPSDATDPRLRSVQIPL